MLCCICCFASCVQNDSEINNKDSSTNNDSLIETPNGEHKHIWQNATCLTPKQCSICGEIDGVALGHEEIVIPGKKATCISAGRSDSVQCNRCKLVLVQSEFIPISQQHNYDACQSYCQDCYRPGLGIHTYDNDCDNTCNICSWYRQTEHVFVDNICTLCQLDHTSCIYDNDCDTQCNACENTRNPNHTYVLTDVKIETCQDDMWLQYTCSVCNTWIMKNYFAHGMHEYENGKCKNCDIKDLNLNKDIDDKTWTLLFKKYYKSINIMDCSDECLYNYYFDTEYNVYIVFYGSRIYYATKTKPNNMCEISIVFEHDIDASSFNASFVSTCKTQQLRMSDISEKYNGYYIADNYQWTGNAEWCNWIYTYDEQYDAYIVLTNTYNCYKYSTVFATVEEMQDYYGKYTCCKCDVDCEKEYIENIEHSFEHTAQLKYGVRTCYKYAEHEYKILVYDDELQMYIIFELWVDDYYKAFEVVKTLDELEYYYVIKYCIATVDIETKTLTITKHHSSCVQ